MTEAFRNPFVSRKWLDQNRHAAAAAAGSNNGLKGIVAGGITGKYISFFIRTYVIRMRTLIRLELKSKNTGGASSNPDPGKKNDFFFSK